MYIFVFYIAVPSDIINLNTSNGLTYKSVYLEWDPPVDDGGDTVNYIISVSPSSDNSDNTGGCTCADRTCKTSSTRCNVTGLSYGVKYNFTVLANNSVGMSDGVSREETVPIAIGMFI